MEKSAVALSESPKFLVVKLRALGDTVMSTAFINALKERHPQSEIHFVCPKQWAAALENHPAITRVYPFDFKSKNYLQFLSLLKLAMELRRERFSVGFALHAGSHSSLLLYLAGITERVVHNHNFKKGNLFGTVEVPGKQRLRPALERDALAFSALGWERPQKLHTSLHLREEELAWATAYLARHELRKPLLVLGLGASRLTKIWPMENFAHVACDWARERDGSVLALCSRGEIQELGEVFGKEIQRLRVSPQRVRIESSLSLRELMAVVSQARLFVGNDSGPKHVAVALDIPTLTLFGPEDPFEYHPYDLKKHPYLFIEDLACRTNLSPGTERRWCGLHVCQKEKLRCLTNITASETWSVIKNSMNA
jgi:lipopolysaccharide heptosyltransferase II